MTYLIASEARKNLYKLIDLVAENHEPTIIKGKRNAAVLISEQDWKDIVKPIELGDTNFVLTLRKQVSRFPPQLGMTTYNRYVLYHLIL
ncbi:type II toxin-antitoxin system Phd/YefM family antitoxin [Candidatus Tisiphia endosymbiont of Hybos culiciformis]|uniref:type II toxin-antitoxin system Phd/YefM family antitoxin n=1 Tax=Candidatus Tisiphia endosymbiont of Hybos culiciformis TaxID=3139331 RepID=UPI003CCA8B8A